jgi:RHS repeat-associated protein
MVSNQAGANATSYTYSPYGRLTSNSGNNGNTNNPFTYTGREDVGLGLSYYRARYYDASLERFISDDPMGDAQRYVSGNPLSFTDPLGLYGIVLQSGVSYEAGIGVGYAGQAGAAIPLLIGSKGVNSALLASSGFLYPGQYSNPVDNCYRGKFTTSKNTQPLFGVLGAYAGGSLGIGFTNADTTDDLLGLSNSYNFGVGHLT